MTLQFWRHLGAAAVAGCCVLAIGAVPADAAEHDDIPVAGTFAYHDYNMPSNPVDHGAIHAVVRIPHGTAVFYSVGGPQLSAGGVMPSPGLLQLYGGFDAWAVGIVDTTHLRYYIPMVDISGDCLCSSRADISESRTGLNVGWAIVPPLPKNVTTVTVTFGFAGAVTDVPVTDHLPEPIVARAAVTVGHGWPALPPASRIAGARPGPSTRSLVRSVANKTATTHRSSSRESIALAADVLFAVDKAALTPRANATLRTVAAQINAKGRGTVDVVGYTDSTGTEAYNQRLSEARAHAVKKALAPLVTARGITLRASGRGEHDPVADNTTAAGRQLNRRVTVTFNTGGQ